METQFLRRRRNARPVSDLHCRLVVTKHATISLSESREKNAAYRFAGIVEGKLKEIASFEKKEMTMLVSVATGRSSLR